MGLSLSLRTAICCDVSPDGLRTCLNSSSRTIGADFGEPSGGTFGDISAIRSSTSRLLKVFHVRLGVGDCATTVMPSIEVDLLLREPSLMFSVIRFGIRAGTVADRFNVWLFWHCGPGSYMVKNLLLARSLTVDSRSNWYMCVSDVSGFEYGLSNDQSILYTCRIFTYESQRRIAPFVRSSVGKRFLVFFEVASGWSGVGDIGKYQERRLAWNSVDLL